MKEIRGNAREYQRMSFVKALSVCVVNSVPTESSSVDYLTNG